MNDERPLDRAHGGPIPAELEALGLSAAELLDFSVNTNPYGPAPSVVAAVRGAVLDRYPDPSAGAARRAIAAAHGLSPERVIVGNGAADLLWAAARAFLGAGDTALVVEPTFSELPAAARAGGARLSAWRAEEARGFSIDLPAVDRAITGTRPGLVYLCTPNTPTGATVPAASAAALAADHPATVFLLDQSFLSLSERHADASLPLPDNVVAIRSLTKEHAIPGVRVGYATAERPLLARIDACRPAWPTSATAEAAAIAACAAAGFVAESRARMLADRRALEETLRTLGLAPVPSSTVFLIIRVGDAARLRRALLERHRILVRDCASFGLPEYVRLCGRPAADCARLGAALREELPRC